MIKECVYFETSDGRIFENLTDAQKYEKEISDPLAHLISKKFSGYATDLKKNLYDVINTNREEFIKALTNDRNKEAPQSISAKVDEVLSRLYEERNLPQGKYKKNYRIKIDS